MRIDSVDQVQVELLDTHSDDSTGFPDLPRGVIVRSGQYVLYWSQTVPSGPND